jgi:hypothetical protein
MECSLSVQQFERYPALRPQPFLLEAGPRSDERKTFLGETDNFVSGQ